MIDEIINLLGIVNPSEDIYLLITFIASTLIIIVFYYILIIFSKLMGLRK